MEIYGPVSGCEQAIFALGTGELYSGCLDDDDPTLELVTGRPASAYEIAVVEEGVYIADHSGGRLHFWPHGGARGTNAGETIFNPGTDGETSVAVGEFRIYVSNRTLDEVFYIPRDTQTGGGSLEDLNGAWGLAACTICTSSRYVWIANSEADEVVTATTVLIPTSNAFLGQGGVRYIVLDDTHAYWTNSAAGTVARVELTSETGATPEIVASGLDEPEFIALDDGRVYWTARGDDQIRYADKAPDQGEGEVLAEVDFSGGLEVHEGFVYFAGSIQNARGIYRVEAP